jgi:hypothetical protein
MPICLRISHTCLTHGHLLCGNLASVCTQRDVILTVLHILMESPCYIEGPFNVSSTWHVARHPLIDGCNVPNVLAFINSIVVATRS